VFITFEGVEGSGKSRQVQALVARLRERDVPVLATHEPGGTPLGFEVRTLALAGDDKLHITARTEALLMNASRAQLVEEVIRPALTRGEVVICDRFADSTLAYQGGGRGLPLNQLRALIGFATDWLTPDLTILLDLPDVALGLSRKYAQQLENRFERETIAFHERVRDTYHALARDDPRRWGCIDARQAAEEVAERVWCVVSERMGLPR
jgi:dTMP kinase